MREMSFRKKEGMETPSAVAVKGGKLVLSPNIKTYPPRVRRKKKQAKKQARVINPLPDPKRAKMLNAGYSPKSIRFLWKR